MNHYLKAACRFLFFSTAAIAGCVSGDSDREPMPGSFHMDDSTGFEFMWERCALKDGKGCINGSFGAAAYSLGFADDGKKLAGSMGTETVEFRLDESDVGALGRDVYELKFLTDKRDLIATVTWNARKGKVIGHAILSTD